MRLILAAEQAVRVRDVEAAGLDVDAVEGITFSPLHMLAASLGLCTASVLGGWARHAGLTAAELDIGVAWEYVDDPHRVGRFRMDIRWPELPGERRAAALRAAEQCTVERTLRHSPVIETQVSG
jgi:uncharacterized OsmC-like protein